MEHFPKQLDILKLYMRQDCVQFIIENSFPEFELKW